jgi:hypothetical protein
MPDALDSEDHLTNGLDSQSLIAYRLGRVEKAVEANNAQAVDRDNNIMNKLETITTLSTQLATTAVRLDNLEVWKKSVNSFLVALTLSMIGLIGTLIIRSLER